MQANDPDRCQRVIPGGQCPKRAEPGSDYCVSHKGKSMELNHYLITNKLLGDTARRHAGSREIKSLRDEIALTRAALEIVYNSIETTAELTAAMPRIHSSILAIEKLVNTCHQMEVKLGILLDKAALLTLAQAIVNIIATNLDGVENKDLIIEKVSREIFQAITAQENADAR